MSFADRLKRLLTGGGTDLPHPAEGEGECGTCRPISCAEAIERIHEYLDGELEEAAASDVAHHFRVCQQCFPHLRLEERFREALRDAQRTEKCPDLLRAQVLELLSVEARQKG
ncbi:MAG: zf-HC2 domain-containing protein [Longimicrobiales bacterium]